MSRFRDATHIPQSFSKCFDVPCESFPQIHTSLLQEFCRKVATVNGHWVSSLLTHYHQQEADLPAYTCMQVALTKDALTKDAQWEGSLNCRHRRADG